MSIASMRPTFEEQLSMSCDEVTRRVSEKLQTPTWRDTSLGFGSYIEIHIPKSELRYWSPHLSLHFEDHGGNTRVFGRFAPRQEVWTLVWGVYLALAFAAFFALIYVYCEWLLGQQTWFIILPPICLVGIIALHIASRIGQYWSMDQMHSLRERCHELLSSIQSPCTIPTDAQDPL